jgi:hypothetical protein
MIVEYSQLILPILLSGVLVFVVSSIMHTVLTYHHSDFKKLGNEDEVRAAVRKGNATAGMYMIPYCNDHKEMKSPENQKKLEEGPLGMLVLRPTGQIKMGPFLAKWMAYTLVVSALAAYLAHSTLHTGATYLEVFRVVGAVAWLAYAWQSPSDSIWKGQPWSVTFKVLFDGLVYASVTAGAFGWLWPR